MNHVCFEDIVETKISLVYFSKQSFIPSFFVYCLQIFFLVFKSPNNFFFVAQVIELLSPFNRLHNSRQHLSLLRIENILRDLDVI